MKIKTKLALVFCCLILAVSVLLGLTSRFILKQHLLSQVKSRLVESSEKVAERLDRMLNLRVSTVANIATNKTLALFFTEPDLVEIMQIEDLLEMESHHFITLSIIDNQGMEVAKVDKGQIDINLRTYEQEFIDQILTKDFTVHNGPHLGNKSDVIFFAHEIKGLYEEYAGVVVGWIDITYVNDDFSYNQPFQEIQTFLAKEYDPLQEEKFSPFLGRLNRNSNVKHKGLDIDKSVEKEGMSMISIDHEDFLMSSTSYDRLGWNTCAIIPYENLVNSIKILTTYLMIVTLVVIGLGILITFFIAEGLTRPINKLMSATRNIMKGDYTKRVTVSSANELGELGEAFNEMSERLRKVTAEKEKEVLLNKNIVDSLQRSEAVLKVNEIRLKALYDLSQMSHESDEKIMDFALESGVQMTGSEIGYIFLLNDEENKLTFSAWSKNVMQKCTAVEEKILFDVDDAGLLGEAVRLRRPVIINDYDKSDHHAKKGYPEGHVPITRHLNVPLISKEKIVLLVGVGNKETDYNDTDIQQLTLIMDGMWRIIQEKKISTELVNAQLIAEKAEMEVKLRQAQKMESIGTLAGGIAHDFNNILTPIYGYVELALMKSKGSPEISHDLKEVQKAAERAKEMVKQILSFSRSDSEQLSPMDVHSVVKEVLKLLRASIPATIEIRQSIDPQCGWVIANPTQVHQVLMNLCTNAYHAMRETGGVLGVSLIPYEVSSGMEDINLEPGSYLRLEVSDTGCGMQSSILERIFEPYFTTKAKGEGSGMGLSVVHGIVKGLNGQISVSSKLGEGTTFHIYLPVIETMADKKEESLKIKVPRGTERIMIVDDEETVRNVQSEILYGLGYDVKGFSKPLEALEVFSKEPELFDLVVTDMTMPKMTGDKFAMKIMEIRPDIPVVLCTGFSDLINKEAALALGIKKYLTKPVLIHQFGVAIREALDGN